MTSGPDPAPHASEDPGDRSERRSRRATRRDSPGRIAAAGRIAAPGWIAATGWGAASFLVVALAGQLVALALGLWGIGGSLATSARIGWLITCLFHHVPIRIAASASGGADAPSAAGTLAAALLTGTAAAAAVLFGAGRRIADRTGGGAVERMLHGAKVAPVYALATFLVSTLVELRVVVPVAGDLTIRPSPLESLAWPLVLAAVAGAGGGRRSAIEAGAHGGGDGRIAAAVTGGWRMLLLGLEFALAGLIVLAVAHPDATAAYARLVIRSGPAGATAIVALHALSLPNHAVFTLVPAMGGCDGIYGEGLRWDAICLDRLPREPSLELITPGSGPRPEIASAPRSFLILLLAPAAATTLGGAAVGRVHRRSGLGRVGLGAGAGAAFAVLVAAASALAGIRVSGALVGGEAGGWITYGPEPLRAGMLALGWGIFGGGIGAMLGGRGHPAPSGAGDCSG